VSTYIVSLVIAGSAGIAILKMVWVGPEVRSIVTSIDWRRVKQSILPLFFLGYLLGGNSQLPVLAMGRLSTPDEIAFYRVANQFAGLIGLLMTAANVTIGPRLAALTKDRAKFEKLLRTTASIVLALAIPACLLLIAGGQLLITAIYGDEYLAATNSLWILCIATLLTTCCGPIVLALNMLEKEIINVQAVLISLFVSLLASVLLVPGLGSEGAALSRLFGVLVWFVFVVWSMKAKLHINVLPSFVKP